MSLPEADYFIAIAEVKEPKNVPTGPDPWQDVKNAIHEIAPDLWSRLATFLHMQPSLHIDRPVITDHSLFWNFYHGSDDDRYTKTFIEKKTGHVTIAYVAEGHIHSTTFTSPKLTRNIEKAFASIHRHYVLEPFVDFLMRPKAEMRPLALAAVTAG